MLMRRKSNPAKLRRKAERITALEVEESKLNEQRAAVFRKLMLTKLELEKEEDGKDALIEVFGEKNCFVTNVRFEPRGIFANVIKKNGEMGRVEMRLERWYGYDRIK